ncbi:hypothetical protein SAMN02927930_00659 [Pseudidiomarina indica]|uniref:Uncharacterized protein n=1 Tax=Pseudidiomarina indica TaxID=1159017 RepID=A0A1G6BAU0_9GAMM|nr:hypothetical protein [Pseudidiomarina indica]SDB17643.1 hypothetical protein SAMN02927930_00659 [Pseudidiomarina indica]
MQIDSTIVFMGAIVKVHWIFSFWVWLPSSLAKLAKLGRRLNEYQTHVVGLVFRCVPNQPQMRAIRQSNLSELMKTWLDEVSASLDEAHVVIFSVVLQI